MIGLAARAFGGLGSPLAATVAAFGAVKRKLPAWLAALGGAAVSVLSLWMLSAGVWSLHGGRAA